MRCFNCGFNTMPGSTRCGRCQADLTLAAEAGSIPIMPPRAGSLEKWLLGGWWAMQRGIGRRLRGLGCGHAPGPLVELPLEAVVWPVVGLVKHPASLVPGLPLMASGQRMLGWSLLSGWMIALFLLILLHGMAFLAIAIASGALAVHAASAVEGTGCVFRSSRIRLVGTVTCAAVLVAVLYVPAIATVIRMMSGRWSVVPFQMAVDVPPMERGDLIWAAPDAPLEAGDIVLEYTVRSVRRVRAMAGEEVAMRGGVLTVSGAPSPWQPVAYQLPEGKQFTVPTDCVFVLDVGFFPPGSAPPVRANGRGLEARIMIPSNLVEPNWMPRLDTITGRVIGRSYPLGRWGKIE